MITPFSPLCILWRPPSGAVLTPLMKVITFLGEKGIIFFLLALIFMCFSSERDTGVCVFGAVCCGALITNIILKDSIARPAAV